MHQHPDALTLGRHRLADGRVGGTIVFAMFGLSLVVEGRANWIALANVFAAIAGVGAAFALAGPFGAPSAQLGGLGAEVVGIAVQAACLFFVRRTSSSTPRDAS